MITRLAYAALALPSRMRDRLYCAKLRNFCVAASDTRFTHQAVIHNPRGPDAVRIGPQTLFMGEIVVIAPAGAVNIGEWCYVGPGAKIWSMETIDIGARVFISHGVQVFDNNSHSLSASERHDRFEELQTQGRHLQPEKVAHKPVRIADDVWIGFNAAILKGVTIGRGAVIGACSVVTHDVPAYSVMVGNPARQVGDSQP